jgi:hypothetical protein
MPNWCSNHITVRGTNQKEISEIAAAMEQGNFLGSIIPVPEELCQEGASTHGGDNAEDYDKIREQNLAKHGYDNWYDFCVNRWGTKWEVQCEGIEVEDDGLTVSCYFDSAWAPPTGVAQALVARGLEVSLYYHESGMCFVGKFEDGIDDYYEYSSESSNTVRAAIGDELDDFFGISEGMAEYEAENEEDLTRWIKDGAEKKQQP